MPSAHVVVETEISQSIRARQVSSMFDVPAQKKCRLEWSVDLPIEDEPWNVGLVVGPSGSGKSTIMREIWGEPQQFDWSAPSVVDDFPKEIPVADVAAACQAVGFNTIPAWLRPFRVLSNGEKFRVELARHLLSDANPIVVDEFTSVVDRQVAKIGAHAVQKHIRRAGRQFVAVTCHYDVLDWLQPDWVYDVSTNQFQRRLLQRRPSIDCVVAPIPRAAWSLFAPYHYMSASLHRSARCFGLWVGDALAAFAALLPRPVSSGARRGEAIWGVSRTVTLPDWQGLGLSFVLIEAVASDYAALGLRLRHYPAHPALVRACDRSKHWALIKRPGTYRDGLSKKSGLSGTMGGRPCAVFEYVGPAATDAPRLAPERAPGGRARAALSRAPV
jgi:ABC-type lipoprotein export system ATPase subunit/GNAT superfamily N-acetyltransferase